MQPADPYDADPDRSRYINNHVLTVNVIICNNCDVTICGKKKTIKLLSNLV